MKGWKDERITGWLQISLVVGLNLQPRGVGLITEGGETKARSEARGCACETLEGGLDPGHADRK